MYLVASVPQLPNECLYLIVNHLRYDLSTLKTLLIVNRFFFHAVVPLMLNNPIDTWDMTYAQATFSTDRDKLFALFLASLIHSQRAQVQKCGDNFVFTANEFLDQYSLKLIEPVSSVLIRDAIEAQKPTTVDYWRYMTQLITTEWQFVQFPDLVRLAQFPQQWIDNGYVKLEDEHTEELQREYEYRDFVDLRFSRIFLELNTERITDLQFHVSLSQVYIPFADKLLKLEKINLDRDASMPDSHLQNTIMFIIKHRAAFPWKAAIALTFSYYWNGLDERDSLSAAEVRRHNRNFQKPRMALYEAIGLPRTLAVCNIPEFYRDCANISPENLEEFHDEDVDRIKFGEGTTDQEEFVQRCKKVKVLKLGVGPNPNMFGWAVERREKIISNSGEIGSITTVRPRSDCIPENLQHLSLSTDLYPENIIPVLEDAIVAFGKSLRELNVLADNQGYIATSSTIETGPLKQRCPKLYLLGQWCLPFIRVIDISIRKLSHVCMGSFQGCPQLESLTISLNKSREEPNTSADEQDASHPHAITDIWKLPRLKALTLCDMAALLFNYDSLDHMWSLSNLTMSVSKKCLATISVASIPRLSSYLCCEKEETLAMEDRDDGAGDSTRWKDCWNLPNLKTLELQGPPSSVFCFSWLAGCPSLEKIYLSPPWSDIEISNLHRLPISSSSKYARILPNTDEIDSLVNDTTFFVDSDSKERTPLLHSKLQRIEIDGNWAISETDLITALTIYMPNLVTLSTGRINKPGLIGGERFVETILEAKAVGRAMAEESAAERSGDGRGDDKDEEETSAAAATAVVPVERLVGISSQYTLSKKSRVNLGIHTVDRKQAMESRASGLAVFTMCRQSHVMDRRRRT
ncbi:hypothetical protein BG004_008354 [Podila humilis]|nr:hypothetical protein BG004_008354 [Podila humilis]